MNKFLCLIIALIFCGCEPPIENGYNFIKTNEGTIVKWYTDEIHVLLDESLTVFGNHEEVKDVIQKAFDEYVIETDLIIDFHIGWGHCDRYPTKEGDNPNCFYSIAYPENNPKAKTIATAFLGWGGNLGAMYNTDIVFYSESAKWILDNEESYRVSLYQVALHEIGHMLGVGHSPNREAMMYEYVIKSEKGIEFELHQDDIDAINELYGEKEEEIIIDESFETFDIENKEISCVVY